MNSDSYFSIGSTHKVCQDYSLSVDGLSSTFIAVSDGCSSSEDTDFGSRILVKSIQNLNSLGENLDNDAIFQKIWDSSFAVSKALKLSYTSLDATLLFAYLSEDQLKVTIVGDGAVSVKDKNGVIHTCIVEYSGNAPLYLSYLYADNGVERSKNRENQFDCTKVITTTSHQSGKILNTVTETSLEPIEHFSFAIKDISHLSIFTDGVSSFIKQETGIGSKFFESIPEYDIVERCMDFKNCSGEFVRRRCIRMMKDFSVQNIKHTDDFSTASICIGGEV